MLSKNFEITVPRSFILFIYLISIFILLTRRKATEALIHRVGNYPDLLPEVPRCSAVKKKRLVIKLSAYSLIKNCLGQNPPPAGESAEVSFPTRQQNGAI